MDINARRGARVGERRARHAHAVAMNRHGLPSKGRSENRQAFELASSLESCEKRSSFSCQSFGLLAFKTLSLPRWLRPARYEPHGEKGDDLMLSQWSSSSTFAA